ncbi:MAG: DUF5716 family protein, partial [Bacilli bacterium]|nr:DUF5716 family protein [Bacilli bacterium]
MKLFDKIPSNFFSLLTKKYRQVYAFALLELSDALRIYKTKIRRSDYAAMLRAKGTEILDLFDIEADKTDGAFLNKEPTTSEETDITSKVNHIIHTMADTGWIVLETDPKTKIAYIYLPSYSIYSLGLIENICSDSSNYMPLVHSTYSELKLEDEKSDEFMFKSLVNAARNAENLELSVTLLHHSICCYNHKLTGILSPNDILEQHFGEYTNEVVDGIYHPMKTYDSVGLYAVPIMNIIRNWLTSEFVIHKLAKQALLDPKYKDLPENERIKEITRMGNKVLDVFQGLNQAFKGIDEQNSGYVESVQKRVRYLSNNDKTSKGKLESVLLALAKEYSKTGDIENCPLIEECENSIALLRSGVISGESLTMPWKRKEYEETEPLEMDDAVMEDPTALNEFIEKEVSTFGA